VEQPSIASPAGSVNEFGLAVDPFGRDALERMNVRATGAQYANPNQQNMSTVNPFGQGVQTQPASLTGGIEGTDWSQGQNAPVFADVMNNPNSDPWAVSTGFVPAFMEVYGDLLKGMTPHEVGSLASQVFLKMR
jgi:hypothetical protein